MLVIVGKVISSNKVLFDAVVVAEPLLIQTLATVAFEFEPNGLNLIL
jgi:hypothetical protein